MTPLVVVSDIWKIPATSYSGYISGWHHYYCQLMLIVLTLCNALVVDVKFHEIKQTCFESYESLFFTQFSFSRKPWGVIFSRKIDAMPTLIHQKIQILRLILASAHIFYTIKDNGMKTHWRRQWGAPGFYFVYST